MPELENNSYQKKVTEKKIEPLSNFLEDVQVKRGVREEFEPYVGGYKNRKDTLTGTLQRLQEANGEDLSGPVSGSDKFYLAPNQRYFLGASSDPQLIIVTRVSDDKVYYYSFPWKKEQALRKDIAVDLMVTGNQTWLSNPKSKKDPDLRASISAVMKGQPGEKVSLEDFQYSKIQVRYIGSKSGDKDPWIELEQTYDVVVDSVLTNKQTYNVRLTNKQLENFEKSLRKSKGKDFKIVRIIREEREYMIESAKNPTPKTTEFDIPEDAQEYWANLLNNNVAAHYSAEGYRAGEHVEYKGSKWVVVDFVPFGEDMTTILMTCDKKKVAQFVKIDDIKKVTGENLNDLEPATKEEDNVDEVGESGETADEIVKKGEKEKKKELKFPESDEDGKTDEQKALKEEKELMTEGDVEHKVEELVTFAENNADIFKTRLGPMTKNLKRKRDNGSYDSDLAVKAFRFVVDDTARMIFEQNEGQLAGKKYSSHFDMFPREVREKASIKMRDEFEVNERVGNNIEEESVVLSAIQKLIQETNSDVEENVKREAVPFTDKEMQEFNKISGANTDTQNVVTYSWDSGGQDLKLTIMKKARPKEKDLIYSAVSHMNDGKTLDKERTVDSQSFSTEDDIDILKDFLSDLQINEAMQEYKERMEDEKAAKEETETVDTTGLADKNNTTDKDVHPEELLMGIEVEMEHTQDKALAKQIALDHLTEIPDYYSRLKRMEATGEAAQSDKEEVKEESSKPKKPKKREPSKTEVKMVNALPKRDGKVVRTEVIGDRKIRYKTFDEKRKEDEKRKKERKTKGDK